MRSFDGGSLHTSTNSSFQMSEAVGAETRSSAFVAYTTAEESGSSKPVARAGFFLGIQVVEITEPFVETVSGGQELVAVTQVVFAELRGGVTRGLEHFRNRRVAPLDSTRRAGNADGRHAHANGHLPSDERGAGRPCNWADRSDR